MRGWGTRRSRRARDALRFATPIAPPLWPPLAEPPEDAFEPVDASVDPRVDRSSDPVVVAESAPQPTTAPLGAHESERSQPSVAESSAGPVVAVQLEMQAEFLRLLEVVTSMCDHVIEYIESDRAERRVMVETLTDLGRVITDSAAAVVGAMAAGPMIEAPAADRARSNEGLASASTRDDEPFVDVRERVIGGSMPAGPDPVIDLVERGAAWDPAPAQTAEPTPAARLTAKDAAVEVRGRIGGRWVEGFEICEVMSTPAGPRYRLRRRTDGVVLPELFEASSIRHVDTVEAHASEHAPVFGNQDAELHDRAPDTNDTSNDLNAPPHYWTRS
ncbi:MAG: hypothetical protein QOJ71_6 [Actinomycetota bacterium]|nr:hypothetical protein [Actinomycetota bacterium]